MRHIFSLAGALVGMCLVGGLTAGRTAAVEREDKDIVQTAADNDQFKTLVKAIEAADLVETLKGEGPFTVFAPTDDAFAKVPKDKLEASSRTRTHSKPCSSTTSSPGKSWRRTWSSWIPQRPFRGSP